MTKQEILASINVVDYDLDGMQQLAADRAADMLAGVKASTANVVLALDRLDRELMRPIRQFSDLAAVSADGDDYGAVIGARQTRREQESQWPSAHRTTYTSTVKAAAEARHAKRTEEALADVTGPRLNPLAALRAMLCDLLQQRGVARDTTCLMAVSDLATAIKSDRKFRSIHDQTGQRWPEWDECRKALRDAGVIAG